MERVKKVIFIIAILGIIGVILFLGGSILKEIIENNNSKKEWNIGKNIIVGTWVCEKREEKKLCIKTLNINSQNEFIFESIEEENNQTPIKYTITGKCYLSDYKNETYKTYKFDREKYENIVNAPEQEYNWQEYTIKEAPTATIKNDKLILFGEDYIKK